MSATQPIAHRHDILILFEVTNGNPNGDPDSGNQPRVDPLSQRGLVSDVCLKRKVRNYVELFPPTANGKSHKILVRQGAVLNREQDKAVEATKDPEATEKEKGKAKVKSDSDHARRVKDWLCHEFFDVRTFGAVISTGSEVMKGSAYGQIRGPAQFSFGQSFDPISPQEITITRCAVTKEEDAAKERTMGQKYIIPYGLYAARCYVSPAFAENTGFDQADFDLLVDALSHLFDHDRSAARGDMVIRGLFDFEHIGTQAESNAEQNRREARLGCAHAHELFESVHVDLKDKTRLPQGFTDYTVKVDGWDRDGPLGEVPWRGLASSRRPRTEPLDMNTVQPVDPEGDDLVPLSALNALLYCDRRAALRHLDGLYIHNEHTLRGNSLHKRADTPGFEKRKGVRTERGLWIVSRRLRLFGRADLVEFRREPGRRRRGEVVVEVASPVEYKRGKKRRWDNDDVQLCAQALCLEEMLGSAVPRGSVYHEQSKSRRDVDFTPQLRAETEIAVARLHELLQSGRIPPAVLKPQCRGCSLRSHCLPEAFGSPDTITNYLRELFHAG